MSAFTDLLERHVPYASRTRDGLACLSCLDVGFPGTHVTLCGEYPTAADWALHVEAELRAAGLKVAKRAAADDEHNEALF